MPLSPTYQSPLDDRVNVGQYTPPRVLCTSNTTPLVSGQAMFSFFTADKTAPITTITTFTGSVAAGATPTVCRLGVWQVASDDALTPVASTVNDTALWAATFTPYPKVFSSGFTMIAGVRYAAGAICVSGATMPQFQSIIVGGTSIMSTNLFTTPAYLALLDAQVNLPGVVAAASLAGNRVCPLFYLT